MNYNEYSGHILEEETEYERYSRLVVSLIRKNMIFLKNLYRNKIQMILNHGRL